MVRKLLQIRVLVASPSDLAEEYTAIKQVADDLNLTWPAIHGITLELISWRTHTHPSVATDPQAAINSQLAADYDIFLGLFWTRIGTETPRAVSGTLEEFERAYTRWRTDPSSVRLMLYFKTTPVPPKEIDPAQLAALRQFQSSLSERGVLYGEFDSADELAHLLRIHLTQQLQEMFASGIKAPPAPATPIVPMVSVPQFEASETEGEEEGFLDLVELSVIASGRATEVIRHFADEMKLMTPRMEQATGELNEVKPDDPARIAKYKRITNRLADAMQDFVARTSPDAPILEESLSASIDSSAKAISLLLDFGSNEENASQAEAGLQAVVTLRDSMMESKASIENLRETVSRVPRATTQFIRARRKYIQLLDSFIGVYDRSLHLITEFEATAHSILGSLKQKPPPASSSPATPAA